MTAVSVWGFTYGATTMQLPERVAALIPFIFYGANTVARITLVPALATVLPSTVLHFGASITLVASMLFYILAVQMTSDLAAGALREDMLANVPMVLACFLLMGLGYSPHYSLMIAAMQQHGDLSAQDHGWYGTSTCLGITAGMWLPGVIALPGIEVAG